LGENTKQLFNNNPNAVKLVESYVNANYEEASKALDKLIVRLREIILGLYLCRTNGIWTLMLVIKFQMFVSWSWTS